MGSQVTAVGTRGSRACHRHEQNDLFPKRRCRFQNAESQSEGQLKCSECRFDWQLSCVCLSLRNKHWVMAEMKRNAFKQHPLLPPPPWSPPTPTQHMTGEFKEWGEKVLTKTQKKKKKTPKIFSYRPPTRDSYLSVSLNPLRGSNSSWHVENEPLSVSYCSFMNQANIWV